MIYENGFAIGDDGRVVMEDSKPAYYFQSLPITGKGNSAGEQGGKVVFANVKAGLDSDGKIVYQDVAVTPYKGKIFYSAGFAHDDQGALLCDSVGKQWGSVGGVPTTLDGFVCIKANSPPPVPVKPGSIVLSTTVIVRDTNAAIQFVEPSTGTKPFDYFAYITNEIDEPETQPLDVNFASKDVFATVTGLKTETKYTVKVFARNSVGDSDMSNAVTFTTKATPVGSIDILPNFTVGVDAVQVSFNMPTGSPPIVYWASVLENPGAKPNAWSEQLDVKFDKGVGTTTVGGLQPETLYKIGLYGVNGAGHGDSSGKHIDFTTGKSEVPVAPILDAVFPAKTSLVFAYTYPQNLEPEFYTVFASDGTTTVKAEVYDPDQDAVIQGLTEGKEYSCWVTATSATGKEGPKSNVVKMTCKSVIPAPNLRALNSSDGKAIVVFDQVTPPEPYVVDHYSYAAVNVAKPDDPMIEAYLEYNETTKEWSAKLPNDITWSVSICAVCNPGKIPGDFSAKMEVFPEVPAAPYRPVITTAYIQPNGQVVIEWTKGVNGTNRNSSALDVKSWQVNVLTADGKGNSIILNIPDPSTTKVVTEKVTIGWWEIIIYANNDNGRSEGSKPVALQYNPTKDAPFMGGVPFEDQVYKYIVCNSGSTTGYEVIRTETGAKLETEVLLVGAGGGGKGQTLALAKGGDGGGGQLVITTLPAPGIAGSIFVSVPPGAKGGSGDNPANTTLKEGSTVIEAIAGKTATDKNNAAGYPRTEVPASWQTLNIFSFLQPGSHFVGGTAISGEQNFPSATFAGQGGAGTKDNLPGKGGESFVAIRWKK